MPTAYVSACLAGDHAHNDLIYTHIMSPIWNCMHMIVHYMLILIESD